MNSGESTSRTVAISLELRVNAARISGGSLPPPTGRNGGFAAPPSEWAADARAAGFEAGG